MKTTISPKFSSTALLKINLAAIVFNYQMYAKRFPASQVSVVLKADAYGTGAVPVAKAIYEAGCRQFCVAVAKEGVQLREHLPDAEIYVFQGLVPGEEEIFAEHRLIPVLVDPYQYELWNQFAASVEEKLPCVLFVDTGMNRLGLTQNQFDQICSDHRLQGLNVKYVMSHLACSEEPEHPMNQSQRERLIKAGKGLPGVPLSLANSDILLLGEDYSFNHLRVGDGLYGLVEGYGLKPAVSLSAPILQIRNLQPGESVGYSATYVVKRPSRIAVIPIGYADGFYWQLGNKGSALFAGHQVPVVGRVSMDMITLDITDIPQDKVYPGAQVEIMGDHYTPNDVAAIMKTNVREVLTRFGHRFERQYVNEPE